MACGCNKNKNSVSRGPTIRPGVYNRSSGGIVSAAQVNAQSQVRSQAIPAATKNEAGLDSSKRKLQARRREAILKTFGK